MGGAGGFAGSIGEEGNAGGARERGKEEHQQCGVKADK